MRVPDSAEPPGAVVGVARLAAVGVGQASHAAGQVMDVCERLLAGQAANGHLLDAHIAQMVVGIRMRDLRRRACVGTLLDFRKAPLDVVGPARDSIAACDIAVVVVGHAASPGGAIALEGVGTLRIEGGERGGRLAHACYAAEVVVDGVGDFLGGVARTSSPLGRVL